MFRPVMPLLGVLVLLAGLSPVAQAETGRRWLADPQFLSPVKQVGPTGGLDTANYVFDMKLLSPSDGWAAAYNGFLRFDGRWWRPFRSDDVTIQSLPATTISSLDMINSSDGWASGASFGSGPPRLELYHFDGRSWRFSPHVVRKDGNIGGIYGTATDLALGTDGSGWLIGLAYVVDADGFSRDQRPLLLRLQNGSWHDVTPDDWPRLSLTALAVDRDGTVRIGATLLPGAGVDARAMILRLADGRWIEESLPPLPSTGQPFSIRSIVAGAAGQSWAIYTDAGTRCASSRLLTFADGAWSLIDGAAHGFQEIRALGLLPGSNRGWATIGACDSRVGNRPARRMHFDNGVFTADERGTALAPTVYALWSDDVQHGAANGFPLRFSAERLPTEAVSAAPAGARYFATTDHTLSGAFRTYYETHGLHLGDPGISDRESLALFGYPVSEPFTEVNPDTGALLTVQYFERARMEHHPDNPEPYRVLLGRLGAATAVARFGSTRRPTGNVPPTPPECSNFGETGYDLCPPLRSFWEGNGALPVFGFPIMAAGDERSLTDGATYLTQWFERERLEHHPANRGTPYEVLLGLLGSEDLRLRGYLP